MSKKILILTPFPPDGIGGAETFVKALIQEASKDNEVTLCTLKPRKKAWKGLGGGLFISTFPIMLLKSLLILVRKRFDIIHAQGLISGLIAVLLKKVFKVKVFITLLALYEFNKFDNRYWAERWCLRVVNFIFNNCDVIFVEGKNGKQDISVFRQDQKIRIFNHWVDQETFKPNPDLRNKYERTNVLFVGRPIHEKGKHIIQEAEKIINNREDYNFTYVENVPYKDLVSYYQNSHVVVVPSLYSEGFARVVAEAASCGCAVITSDKGSLPEMVKDFGMSVEPTPSKFAYEIDTAMLRGLNELSIKYAKENFSSKNAEVFLSAYKDI